ncbi:MAG: lipid-A-disaccharide synthase [Verrucomicrobia bacterium]|nr:lipid-A-disaccharide synthase [Verrucomicrobiota bacterium]
MAGRIYVVAGELSGDAHGAGLLRALEELRPGLRIAGAGGPEMAAVAGAGVKNWVADAAVVGLWEVLKHYRWFKQRFDEMLAAVKSFQPEVLVLIDYPGFNLRFSAAVRRACPATRQVYYISPQVWAWNRRRIPRMVCLLDELLCVFPFEQPIFAAAGLKTTFVGHPLVDELEARRLTEVARDDCLVGLFPGSREREVQRLFPVMIESAKRLLAWHTDLRFEAPAASPALGEQMRNMTREAKVDEHLKVTTGGSHALMQRACCGVIASGTATLEAAYLGLPYCLTYKVAWPTYFAGRMLVRLKHLGLVNILAGEKVIEEFIQTDADATQLGAALREFLQDPEHRARLQARLAETAAKLGGTGAHLRAARAVAAWLPEA